MAESKILIVFDVEDKDLLTAGDSLKKTNLLLNETAKAAQLVTKTVAAASRANGVGFSSMTKDVGEMKKAMQGMIPTLKDLDNGTRQLVETMIEGLAEGFVESLSAAKDELAAFMKKQEELDEKTKKNQNQLQAEYKKTTTALANLIASGVKEGAQVEDLRNKAAELKDELDTLRNQTKGLADSGLGFRAVSEGIGLVSGAFGVATGATALFGEESEALNETLTRLNAITAINTSLEQINNALKKDGALSTAALKVQTTLLNAQKVVENALTSESVVVRGLATAAQWALNVAMAANPIGIVIVALAGLVAILAAFTLNAREAKDAQADFNSELERADEDFRLRQKALEGRVEVEKVFAKEKGKSESEVTAIAGKGLEERLALVVADRKKREAELEKLNASVLAGTEKGEAIREELEKRITARLDTEDELRTQIIINGSNRNQQLAKENAEKLQAIEDQREKDRKAALEKLKKDFDDQIAAQQRIVLKDPAESKESIDAQLKIIDLVARKAVETEEHTKNEIALINEQAAKDKLDVLDRLLKVQHEREINAAIAIEQAKLSDPALGLEGRFEVENNLRELNYQRQRAQLIAHGESTLGIDREIQNQRLAAAAKFEQDLFQQTEELEAAKDAPRQDTLRRLEKDEKQSLTIRLNASKAILLDKQDKLTREGRLNDQLYKDGKISAEQFQKTEADINAERLKNQKDFEEAATETVKTEEEKRLQARLDAAAQVIDFASQAFDTIAEFARLQTERELQAIDYRRERLEALRTTGSITEKEYIRNLKAIDAEEKRIQNESAKREKVFAIFSALLNTAAAVVKALPDIPLSIIVGALGLAQVALIAARPLPKFKTGTRNAPEGLAVVGEGGSELIQQGGRMFLSPPKPSIVWLKRGATVLTAQQTRGALQSMPNVSRGDMENNGAYGVSGGMNPEALARAIGQNLAQINVNIDKDGFSVSQQKGLTFYNYLNDRFKL